MEVKFIVLERAHRQRDLLAHVSGALRIVDLLDLEDDDLDRLTDPQAAALVRYFVANAPQDARLLAGMRVLPDWADELARDRQLTVIGRSELAFTLEESIAFLRQRLPEAVSDDLAARIYEPAGGRPERNGRAVPVAAGGAASAAAAAIPMATSFRSHPKTPRYGGTGTRRSSCRPITRASSTRAAIGCSSRTIEVPRG
jgi:hypothetical protein